LTKLSYTEIHSKDQAIALGKDRGWCTAKEDNIYYERDYNKNKGRLFLLYEEPKKKPQYQIFFSFNGGVELKAKFNVFIDHIHFFNSGIGYQLNSWYEDIVINNPSKHHLVTSEQINRDQMFGRALRQNQHHYSILNGFHPEVANSIRTRVPIRTGYDQRVRLKVKLKIKERQIMRIHVKEELPFAERTRTGSVFYIQEDNLTLLRTIDENRIPIYLEVIRVNRIFPDISHIEIGNNEPISRNIDEVELSFLVYENNITPFDEISNLVNQYQTGNFDYTLKYVLK